MGVVMIAGFLLGSYAHALFYQVTMFLTLLLAPLGLMLYTRKQAGGYLNYGKTFQAGFIPIFLSVCILSVFYFLYLQYLNPLAFEYEKQKTAANLKSSRYARRPHKKYLAKYETYQNRPKLLFKFLDSRYFELPTVCRFLLQK